MNCEHLLYHSGCKTCYLNRVTAWREVASDIRHASAEQLRDMVKLDGQLALADATNGDAIRARGMGVIL